MESDLSDLDTKDEKIIKRAIRMEGVKMLEMLRKQEAERKSSEQQLLGIIENVQKHWRTSKQVDDFGFQNDVASYLVGIDASSIRRELSQGVKQALLTKSVTAKNPVVMAAESIIWDIDDELARRELARQSVRRALALAKESKEESARQVQTQNPLAQKHKRAHPDYQQVLDQAHKVALKHGLLRSFPLLVEARRFSAQMLQQQQKKRDKEEELRSAIEDAKNALDDSKRRFLLVLMLGGIVVGAASSWAVLVMSQTA